MIGIFEMLINFLVVSAFLGIIFGLIQVVFSKRLYRD